MAASSVPARDLAHLMPAVEWRSPPRKRCPHCRLALPADTAVFYPEPSRSVGLSAWCRDCTRERQRRRRDRIRSDPDLLAADREYRREAARLRRIYAAERVREQNRVYWARLKADPEAHARQLAYRRERYARLRTVELLQDDRIRPDREGKRLVSTAAGAWKPLSYHDGDDNSVDPTPLIEMLVERFPYVVGADGVNSVALAAAVGFVVPDRRLRGWIAGDNISLDAVDRILTHGLGEPWMLNELYPPDDSDIMAA